MLAASPQVMTARNVQDIATQPLGKNFTPSSEPLAYTKGLRVIVDEVPPEPNSTLNIISFAGFTLYKQYLFYLLC